MICVNENVKWGTLDVCEMDVSVCEWESIGSVCEGVGSKNQMSMGIRKTKKTIHIQYQAEMHNMPIT